MLTIVIKVGETTRRVDIDQVIGGCLGLHKPNKGRGWYVTHLQSGIMVAKVAPGTPIRKVEEQLLDLATVLQDEANLADIDEETTALAKGINRAIDAINAYHKLMSQ